MSKPVSIKNTPHYKWGDNCDGWFLLNQPGMSIILEAMPANTKEVIHYHEVADQFFYVLEGQAQMSLDEDVITIGAGEGLSIPAGSVHQIHNSSDHEVKFIVISNPNTKGDRHLV